MLLEKSCFKNLNLVVVSQVQPKPFKRNFDFLLPLDQIDTEHGDFADIDYVKRNHQDDGFMKRLVPAVMPDFNKYFKQYQVYPNVQ